jgi:hypothetical protein
MLLATINSSIILIALDIFRRIHLDPLTPANTNYLLRTTACLLVGWARVLSPEGQRQSARFRRIGMEQLWNRGAATGGKGSSPRTLENGLK